MKKLKWWFKNHTKYEEYSVLYEDENFMLVQDDNSKKYSFGVIKDFGSLYGFPVNQSCLTNEEAIEQLRAFVRIDNDYLSLCGDIAERNIQRWENMIEAIERNK